MAAETIKPLTPPQQAVWASLYGSGKPKLAPGSRWEGDIIINRHGERHVICSDGQRREESWARRWEELGKPKITPLIDNQVGS